MIGVVALLVFGPKGLAEVARNLGKTLKTFQPTIKELQVGALSFFRNRCLLARDCTNLFYTFVLTLRDCRVILFGE